MNKNMDYNLYVLAEIAYKKDNKNISEKELFPSDWYSISNYKVKVEILAQAIKEKKLIKDTELYHNRIEGIKLNKKQYKENNIHE